MPHRTPLRMLFPPVPPFDLRDGSAALLVLDLQPFTTDRSVGIGRIAEERGVSRELDEYFEQLGYGLTNATDLVAAFRAANLPIIFTRLAAPADGPASLAAYGGTLPAADSPEAQLLPSIAPPAGSTTETVLLKSTLSPFAGTDLDVRLRKLRVRTLVLAGVMTGWAIELTAREAADRGYQVQVASDACPGETYDVHGFVMPQLVGGLIRVRPTESILEMVEGTRT
jgi:nicotinamidase-related amidase